MEQGHGYWIYALVWTPAMVVLAVPQGGSATLSADAARVVFTLVAAVSVVAVTLAAADQWRCSILRGAQTAREPA